MKVNLFINETVLCNDADVCINYSAMIMFLTGQVLWSYYSFNGEILAMQVLKSGTVYIVHCLPLFMLNFGIIQTWTLTLQLVVDIALLSTCSLLDECTPVKKKPVARRRLFS